MRKVGRRGDAAEGGFGGGGDAHQSQVGTAGHRELQSDRHGLAVFGVDGPAGYDRGGRSYEVERQGVVTCPSRPVRAWFADAGWMNNRTGMESKDNFKPKKQWSTSER